MTYPVGVPTVLYQAAVCLGSSDIKLSPDSVPSILVQDAEYGIQRERILKHNDPVPAYDWSQTVRYSNSSHSAGEQICNCLCMRHKFGYFDLLTVQSIMIVRFQIASKSNHLPDHIEMLSLTERSTIY